MLDFTILTTPRRNGWALFCPRCGQTWAKIRTVGNHYLCPITVPCEEHWRPGWHGVPGSLLQTPITWAQEFSGDRGLDILLKRLPDAWLQHEFNQALKWAERQDE